MEGYEDDDSEDDAIGVPDSEVVVRAVQGFIKRGYKGENLYKKVDKNDNLLTTYPPSVVYRVFE